ncbi:glutathione S-transferase family protein [Sphingomonas nostoxanthinifaciens]|uniref:glutathione S-transferase family protein n=1 Tax=Sphingomonas nostoxanthinifaciens TaxID=2872652 RepID=UPI001CC1CC62|nr:glutathione S-transferase family protein [Sphingomonas nostoxanthinifaciens]UAK24228.1 glutathione S-transferase family protein [Sphingomonas nostoxanthinifaciens]
MLKIVIGNKAYSSWSMRGWLAVKQSGLPHEEMVVPLYDENWDRAREGAEFAPSSGKVPILWDGDIVVWDSLAIIDYLADKAGRDLFWPADDAARAAARSMAAEMHSSFTALRREHSMNVRARFPQAPLSPEAAADVQRVVTLWAEARSRWGTGGDFLFGAFSAADIMFAPVVTRFVTYSVPVPRFAVAYGEAVLAHPFVAQWIAEAQDEPWVIEKYEPPVV